jgi:methionyl-tRNA formyltransferase
MRIVFMGTPGFSATILENLMAVHEVVGVYTRADAVRGRGRKLVPSPVKQIALRGGIPVFTPKTFRDPLVFKQLRDLRPDCICVAAYGMLLPREVLELPRYGCVNVHASLLPRWRGAAPVERAILAGDERVGVCIMRMEEGLDTGDFCVVRSTEVGSKTTTEVTAELADLGSQALLTALTLFETGYIEWTEQDDFFSSYADKIAKREFYLSPRDLASQVALKVQASSPAHPARCVVASRDVAITRAQRVPSRLLREEMALRSGRIILYQKKLYLGCFDQPVEVLEVKPEGKRVMSGKDFAAGIQNVKSGLITWEALDV